MRTLCRELPGPKMANLVEGGETPVLRPAELADIGYRLAVYPLTVMSSAMGAMVGALRGLKEGPHPDAILPFAELRRRVGFDDYYEMEQRYSGVRD